MMAGMASTVPPAKYSDEQRAAVVIADATPTVTAAMAAAGQLRGVDGVALPAFSIPMKSVSAYRTRAKRRLEDLRALREQQREAIELLEGAEPRPPEEIAASVEQAFKNVARERERQRDAERVEPPRIRVAEDFGSILRLGLSPEEARAVGLPLPPRRRRVKGFPSNYNVPPW
jgi:hypothetical protein